MAARVEAGVLTGLQHMALLGKVRSILLVLGTALRQPIQPWEGDERSEHGRGGGKWLPLILGTLRGTNPGGLAGQAGSQTVLTLGGSLAIRSCQGDHALVYLLGRTI